MAPLSKIFAVLAASFITLAIADQAPPVPTKGDFNVLTMNVGGISGAIDKDGVPEDQTNAKTIGKLFSSLGYKIINMQEDFHYNDNIYANVKYLFKSVPAPEVPNSDGLNTISAFTPNAFERVKWNKCSQASEFDCDTANGFTIMRAQIATGVFVDVYNLRADAGVKEEDKVARASNFDDLATYIDVMSAGNPVIILGDTSSLYTRQGDNPTIFVTRNGMRDVFVELHLNGVDPTVEKACKNPSVVQDCETTDKVFYRGSRQLQLEATYFNYESPKFISASGGVLSDHNPITVNFTWSVSDLFQQSDLFGNPSGQWFNDLTSLPDSPKVETLTFRSGSELDQVRIGYVGGKELTHGGLGGGEKTWVYLCAHLSMVELDAHDLNSNGTSIEVRDLDVPRYRNLQGKSVELRFITSSIDTLGLYSKIGDGLGIAPSTSWLKTRQFQCTL
ncbi:endonuclease/Exonuclease/phosphatase [Diplocarpon mali]|nr:endonuclease/Exonuclease/phosphatase [Diplocarpon mali]